MSYTLTPCPFCGGEAHFERMGTPRQSCIVECGSCGARHESSDEGERSGTQWNDRAARPPGTWLERLHAERDELLARLDSLQAFIASDAPAWVALADVPKALLVAQMGTMASYLAILDARLKAAKETQS